MRKKKLVAIYGVGMMGGSLGLALRKKSSYRVLGIGRNRTRLKKAIQLGACDEVTMDLARGVQSADIIVICTSISEIISSVKKMIPLLKPNTVLTDIGSVKGPIQKSVQNEVLQNSIQWIGGHPLAGSEKVGVQNASISLYQSATVVLCPISGTTQKSLKLVQNLWNSVGARTLTLSPEIHDVLVAQTSHLPHVLASLLVQLIARLQRQDSRSARLLAGSFKDMTRIVDTDPKQWAEISQFSGSYLVGALKSYRDLITGILKNVESSSNPYPEWEKFFSRSKAERIQLLQPE